MTSLPLLKVGFVAELQKFQDKREHHGEVDERFFEGEADGGNAVRVGTIDNEGMDKLLGFVLSCLIVPGMMIVSEC